MRRLRRALLVPAASLAMFGSALSAPAQAEIKFCSDGNPTFCTISYQTYPYSSTGTGLRSSMLGSFNGAVIGSRDQITGEITVYDLHEDGYRARVWVDIFYDCFCVSPDKHVPGPTSDATRVFDSTTSSGTRHQWGWANTHGHTGFFYTVRVIVGRYQGSTGRFNQAEEQRFYLTMGGN